MSDLSISCILPVMNETYSLDLTVKYLEKHCNIDICEYLIVVCNKTKDESLKVCDNLKKIFPDKVRIHWQKLPFLGGALREAFSLANGTHILLMASDLETDPRTVPKMIDKLRNSKNDIIVTSRWIKGGGFSEYNPIKYIFNFIFQQTFTFLYKVKLTDLTYAFRIYNAKILKLFKWEELRHAFLFECIIKPLRFGFSISEIPTFWKARTEGSSSNTFLRNFNYFPIGFRTRFRRKKSLLLPKYRYLVDKL